MAMSSVNKTETFHFYPEEAFIFAAISDKLKCVEKMELYFLMFFFKLNLCRQR